MKTKFIILITFVLICTVANSQDTQSLPYKGINFDRDALIEAYYEYVSVTATNNGIVSKPQREILDEALIDIGNLLKQGILPEFSPTHTTFTYKGYFGFTSKEIKSDKWGNFDTSQLRSFAVFCLDAFLEKSVKLNKQ